MASYTSNYQLHQWVPEDDFLRSDFNEDFQKIDAAIRAAKAQAEGLETSKAACTTGTYSGNNSSKDINLGFQPKAILVENSGGSASIGGRGLALWGSPVIASSGATIALTGSGFTVAGAANSSGAIYYYMALQ